MEFYNGDISNGEIEIQSTEKKYGTPYFDFYQDKVIFPNEQKGEYTRIEPRSEGVAILPINSDGQIVLIRSFRHAIRSFSIEVPRGFMNKAESPAQAAMRELKEEINVSAADFIYMGSTHPENSIMNSQVHQYFAHNIIWNSSNENHSDGGAIDTTLFITKEDFNKMILNHEINDAYTLGLYAKAIAFGYL
ncbi:NUDIX hydrolase [Paenibacillus segetis]|uniref:Nudix hydrolase domain-containing protein n=1 Tax=Paenibacillus segetis TaxID=1325360 RepID=A0ABQ1YTW1_9BACL|nr:NUDIX hydrolase [Paenibacillus segetis]GGH36393.1 hypothetical protein GCM10008013_43240 [Paenibacillus segetis]